jgi:hypothetical protein
MTKVYTLSDGDLYEDAVFVQSVHATFAGALAATKQLTQEDWPGYSTVNTGRADLVEWHNADVSRRVEIQQYEVQA